MYTTKEIALEIDKLKPDITDFLQLFNERKSIKEISTDIQHTQNTFVKLFKCEIYIIHYVTHNRLYKSPHEEVFDVSRYVLNNVSDCYTRNYRGKSKLSIYDYNLSNNTSAKITILNNITGDIKPYLTKYLWDKIRPKQTKTLNTANLEPNKLSLAAFKQFIKGSNKKISSANTIRYFNQIKEFNNNIDKEFLEVLFTNCDKLSATSLKKLNEDLRIQYYWYQKKVTMLYSDYVGISREQIRHMAHTSEVTASTYLWDTQDSAYTPFITNVPRKITVDDKNFKALIDYVVVLSSVTNGQDIQAKMIKSILEHLAEPEYKESLIKYKAQLEKQLTPLNVIKGLL